MEIAFLLVVAAATTVTLPVVGALLIFSLMIGPPAAARCPRRPPGAGPRPLGSLALLTAWAAIASSYQTNWPVGFFVGSTALPASRSSRVWVGLVRRRGPAPTAPGRSAAEEQGVVRAPA